METSGGIGQVRQYRISDIFGDDRMIDATFEDAVQIAKTESTMMRSGWSWLYEGDTGKLVAKFQYGQDQMIRDRSTEVQR